MTTNDKKFASSIRLGLQILVGCTAIVCLYQVALAQVAGYRCEQVPAATSDHSRCRNAAGVPVTQCGLGVCRRFTSAPYSACLVEDECYVCSITKATGTAYDIDGNCMPNAQGTFCYCAEWDEPSPKTVTVTNCTEQRLGSC